MIRSVPSALLRFIAAVGGSTALFLFAAPIAQAHGFGERYDLPVPLSFFIVGAIGVIGFSFLVTGLFASNKPPQGHGTVDLISTFPGKQLSTEPVLSIMRLASVIVFVAFLVAALTGSNTPSENIAPVMVWIIFWVGIAYVNGFLGNIWDLINPWAVIFTWPLRLLNHRKGATKLPRLLKYPEWMSAWPAVLLFLAWAWIEIVYTNGAEPRTLGVLTLLYSAITWSGMAVFGRDIWLKNCEVFTLVFGFFARFALTEGTNQLGQRRWRLRVPGSGLVNESVQSPAHSIFIVIVLTMVTFDGFAETSLWSSIISNAYDTLGWAGPSTLTILATAGLLAAPVAFLTAYSCTMWSMHIVTGRRIGIIRLGSMFAVTLIPIALAYHVAHYFSFLLIQGQRIFPLLSDPLGRGWDLFGTADWTINLGIVDAQLAWFIGVASLVLGHVVAVYAAHQIAMINFDDDKTAVISQIPMVALMIFYTAISLWILAQPITLH